MPPIPVDVHSLQRAWKRWILRRRRPEARAAAGGSCRVLESSAALRISFAVALAVIVGFAVLGAALIASGQGVDRRVGIGLLVMTAVLAAGALAVHRSQVAPVFHLHAWGVEDTGNGIGIRWKDLARIEADGADGLRLVAAGGRKIRVPLSHDGLGSLRALLEERVPHLVALPPAAGGFSAFLLDVLPSIPGMAGAVLAPRATPGRRS